MRLKKIRGLEAIREEKRDYLHEKIKISLFNFDKYFRHFAFIAQLIASFQTK